MDTSEILTLLERLDDEIDDLEEAAAPLLKTTISDTASKLPLLDKAKLYVLMTYSIESLLFSYIRLHGVNARDHPVFRELTRVKQYFDKIKVAETPVVKRDLALDRQAAHRFITAGLAGNDKYDLQRAELAAREKVRSHIKFVELAKKQETTGLEKKEEEEVDEDEESSDESNREAEVSTPGAEASQAGNSKKRKLEEDEARVEALAKTEKSRKRKMKKRKKKLPISG